MSYADLVLWQVLDGVGHAFPRRVGRLREEGEYGRVWALYERVQGLERIKEYLGSERRQEYSMGIYRHYPELDGEE
jgi:glutathione S-transferase